MSKKITTQEFIDRSRVVHGDKYGYAFSVYNSAHEKVFIHCPEHGTFEQKAADHLHSKAGCPDCGGSKKKTNTSFICSAKKIHGQRYCYDNVNYINAHTDVSITCEIHGDFLQAPNHHLKGSGCPKCRKSGFNTSLESIIYLLRSECGRYAKVGITQNYKNRSYNLKHATPFKFYLVESLTGPGDKVAYLEKSLLSEYQPVTFKDTFDGHTEWRLWDSGIRHKLLTSKI